MVGDAEVSRQCGGDARPMRRAGDWMGAGRLKNPGYTSGNLALGVGTK